MPFYSAVTGEVVDSDGLDAGYWYANVREPVRFAEVIEALAGAEHTVFIEISPHPVLVSGDERDAGGGRYRSGGGRVAAPR